MRRNFYVIMINYIERVVISCEPSIILLDVFQGTVPHDKLSLLLVASELRKLYPGLLVEERLQINVCVRYC